MNNLISIKIRFGNKLSDIHFMEQKNTIMKKSEVL